MTETAAEGRKEHLFHEELDFLRDVMECSATLMVVLDEKGRLIRFNRACETATGRSFAGLVGEPLEALFRPCDPRGSFLEVFRMLSEYGCTMETQTEFCTGSGEPRFFLWSYNRLRGEDHRPDFVLANGVDITGRILAERQLVHRLAMERLVADISNRFLDMSPDRFVEGVTSGLAEIGRFTGSDRCYLFFFRDDGARLPDYHFWVAPEQLQRDPGLARPVTTVPLAWFDGQLLRQQVVQLKRLEEIPAEGQLERDVFSRAGIRSVLAVPLARGGRVRAVVGFNRLCCAEGWTEEDIRLLRMVGEIFLNAHALSLYEKEREMLVRNLQEALQNIKTLRGLIPICANCKKVRDDQGFWRQVEEYVRDRSEADFSHGICPECIAKLYPEYYEHMVQGEGVKG